MKSKMIFFNGPKGCGKNTLIDFCKQTHWEDISCKLPLYDLVQKMFNCSYETFWGIYLDRTLKELPSESFRVCLTHTDLLSLVQIIGRDALDPEDLSRDFKFDIENNSVTLNLSVREAMIYISEVIIKPRWGEDYFGKARMRDILNGPVYYDDSAAAFNGDAIEMRAAIEHFGEENCLLVRIHGRGSFEGDSRGYIPDKVLSNVIDITNNGTLEEFLFEGQENVYKWLGDVGIGA